MNRFIAIAFLVLTTSVGAATFFSEPDRLGLTVLISDLLTPDYTMADITCLTDNVYHEARGETRTGQRAVVEVVMSRVADTRWGGTVCGVVYHPYAFSWTIDPKPVRDIALWEKIREDVIWYLNNPLKWDANHYHADTIMPYWAPSMTEVAHIGGHIFYTDNS